MHSIQISSFCECGLYPHYFSLDPEILRQESLVAISPCTPSRFSFSASFRNCFAFALSRGKYSHIPCINSSFPNIFHNLPPCAFLFHHCLPLPRLQRRLALCRQSYVATLMTQIDRVGLSPTIDNYRSKLPESECFVTAGIVVPKHRSSWNAERAWHETYYFCFLQALVTNAPDTTMCIIPNVRKWFCCNRDYRVQPLQWRSPCIQSLACITFLRSFTCETTNTGT